MTPPPDGKSHPSEGMRPVLFPMRLFPTHGANLELPSSNGAPTAPTDASVQWVCMDPLQMVEALASATEEREGGQLSPIRINDTALASPTPAFPVQHYKGLKGDEQQAATTSLNHGAPPLPPWDPSFLLCYDANALSTVERLQSLARTLESMSHYHRVLPSYRRARDHLANTSGWIHNHFSHSTSDSNNEKDRLLHVLYDETIQKMEALIDTVQKMAEQDQAVAGTSSSSSKPPSKTRANKNFSEYMVQWLKDNWTNPYPDEDGLMEIARECETTTTVVSNWLINARTRKWRPAIVKAYNMKRPADLLLEDAINIFDGKPLRSLNDSEKKDAAQKMPSPPSAKRRRYN